MTWAGQAWLVMAAGRCGSWLVGLPFLDLEVGYDESRRVGSKVRG